MDNSKNDESAKKQSPEPKEDSFMESMEKMNKDIVMKNASSASAEQIEMLQKLMPKKNYQDIQPINDRKIYREIITD